MTHIPPEDQRITPEQADGLAQLHAEMMMTLEVANWPLGGEQDIWVATRTLDREELRARRKEQRERDENGAIERTEKVFLREFAISAFMGLLFTRTGAIYAEVTHGSPSGVMSFSHKLVAFTTLTETDQIENAMRGIIDECVKRMSANVTT